MEESFETGTTTDIDIIGGDVGRKWLQSGESPYGFTKYLKVFINEFVDEIFDDVFTEAANADMILYSTLFPMGKEIANYYHIPYLCVFLQPLMPTTEYPAMMMPRLTGKIPVYNKLTHKITEFLFYNVFSGAVNKWRGNVLGLRPFSYFRAFGMHSEGDTNYMMPISDIIFRRPHDWGGNIIKTDNWFYEDETEDNELDDFLDSDQKTVYIGFGSMNIDNKEIILETLHKLTESLNVKVILCSGWTQFEHIKSKQILVIKQMNHFKYLEQMDMIIHHGGSGTTSSAFRAGKPQLVMPFFADQFFWADTVVSKECGLKIPFHSASSNSILSASNAILKNTKMKHNAQIISRKLKMRNGSNQAVSIIEQYLS